MCPREWSSWGLVARYWKDPRRFKPERFLGDWPKDAFIPFSQGKSSFVSVLCRPYSILLYRCPGLSGEAVRTVVISSRSVLTDNFQILRDGRDSDYDHAGVEI